MSPVETQRWDHPSLDVAPKSPRPTATSAIEQQIATLHQTLVSMQNAMLHMLTLELPVVEEINVQRDVWLFQQADWELMEDMLTENDWSPLQESHPDTAV